MPGKRHLQNRESSGTEYELEAIVAKRKLRNGEIQYRARWSGYGSSDDTWEPLANVVESQAFADFEANSSSSSSATVAANVAKTSRQKQKLKKKTDEKKQLQQQHSDENNAPVPSTSDRGQALMLQQMVVVGTNTVIRWAQMRPTAAMLIEGSKKD